ncbi:MAG: hypothetical protein LC792_12235 [Actinobacteria bacterium]|nr:hypothetical protein [Actinomycetota bacterium]
MGASIGDVWALLGGGPLLQDVPVPKIIRIIRSPLGRVMVRLPGSVDGSRRSCGRWGTEQASTRG